jgi:hypothetical protein
MKSPHTLIALLTFFATPLFSQFQTPLQWASKAAGTNPNGAAQALCITTDPNGNVYNGGTFHGIVDFDPGPATYTRMSVNPAGDVFIWKLNANGTFAWVITAGGPTLSTCNSIDLDKAGNVYIGGYFSSTVDFDPSAASFNLTSAGNQDLFLAKYSSNGAFIWAKRIGAAGNDAVDALDADTSGNVFATGVSVGNVDFDPGPGTYTVPGTPGGTRAFVLRLDSAGNFGWARVFTGFGGGTMGHAIKCDGAGNVYSAGRLSGTTDFDPGTGTYTLAGAPAGGYVSKLSASGNFVWASLLRSTQGAYPFGMAVTRSGDVYLSGEILGTVDFDPGPGLYTVTCNQSDAFFCKLNGSGGLGWARQITGNFIQRGYDVAIDTIGNAYWFGDINGAVDMDPGPATFSLGGAGNRAVFSKFTPNGSFIGAKIFSSTTRGNAMAIGRGGTLHFAGTFTGPAIDFDPEPTTFTMTSGANAAAYCVKLAVATCVSGGTITVAGRDSICMNSVVTLSATGANIYYWNTGAYSSTLSVSPTVSTVYTVTGIDTIGCISSQAHTISVLPAPNIAVNSGSICEGHSFTLSPTGATNYTITGDTTVVSPSVTTVYTVSASNSIGCFSEVSSTVTVMPPPALTINAPDTLCAGHAALISVSGAFSYTWGSGSTIPFTQITPTVTTAYSATGTSAFGCSATAVTEVTVIPSPTVTITANKSIVCNGEPLTLTANGASTYTWLNSSNDPTLSVSPVTTSTYIVTGTQGKCNASASFVVQTATCNGISEFGNAVIKVYPNPFSEWFVIETNGLASDDSKVFIYDLQGKLILEQPLLKHHAIQCESLGGSGVFLILVKDGPNIRQRQLVVRQIE